MHRFGYRRRIVRLSISPSATMTHCDLGMKDELRMYGLSLEFIGINGLVPGLHDASC